MMLKDNDELANYLDGEQAAMASASTMASSNAFQRVMPVVAFLLGDPDAITAANPCDYWQRARPIVLFIVNNPLAKAFLPAKLIAFLTTWMPVIDGMCPVA